MSFLGIDLINVCIEKTKKFLFPINKILWLKLALVTILAGLGSSSPNFNFNTGQNIPADITQAILNNMHWILLGVLGILILGIIFALIRSLFNFVLLESIEKKQCMIKNSLSANTDLAISYFLLSLVINGIFLIVIIGLLTPLFIMFFNTTLDTALLVSSPYLWIAIPLLVLLVIISSIINSILYNLVMPDMYLKRIKAVKSFKRMYKLFLKELKQVIIYWIMKFLLGMAAGIIGMLVFFLMLIVFIIIGLLIFGLGFLISMISSVLVIPLIIIGILLGIVLLILLIYSVAVILVPIGVFFTNYRLDFYKGLNLKNRELLQSLRPIS